MDFVVDTRKSTDVHSEESFDIVYDRHELGVEVASVQSDTFCKPGLLEDSIGINTLLASEAQAELDLQLSPSSSSSLSLSSPIIPSSPLNSSFVSIKPQKHASNSSNNHQSNSHSQQVLDDYLENVNVEELIESSKKINLRIDEWSEIESDDYYDPAEEASDDEHIKAFDLYGDDDDSFDSEEDWEMDKYDVKLVGKKGGFKGKTANSGTGGSGAGSAGGLSSKKKKRDRKEQKKAEKNANATKVTKGDEILSQLSNRNTFHKEALGILVEINNEMRNFMQGTHEHTLLPPLPSSIRALVQILAERYNLTSNVQGSKHKKMIALVKRKHSQVPVNWKALPYQIIKKLKVTKLKKTDVAQVQPAANESKRKPTAGPKVGEKIGANTAPINATNVGHQLLMSMGWKPGTGLGSEENKGILDPISVKVRSKRSGLG